MNGVATGPACKRLFLLRARTRSTDEDQRLWKANRTMLKDLPSTHFEDISRKTVAAL